MKLFGPAQKEYGIVVVACAHAWGCGILTLIVAGIGAESHRHLSRYTCSSYVFFCSCFTASVIFLHHIVSSLCFRRLPLPLLSVRSLRANLYSVYTCRQPCLMFSFSIKFNILSVKSSPLWSQSL